MNPSSYRFTLDLHSTQSQISLPVTLGDTARVFYISFADGGQPYTLADGCRARVNIKRPTGTRIAVYCAIESNTTIKYDFENNPRTAVVEGIHDCSVTLYDAEGKEISSPRFTMVVSEDVINFDDITLSDDDKDAIQDLFAQELARQEAEIGRKNAEDARVAAEKARVVAEQEREALKAAIESFIGMGGAVVRMTEVTLLASAWVGEASPYSQVVSIDSVITEYTKVDLLPSVEQLEIFHEKDLAFVTENDGGVVTVYAVGDKPKNDYTMQASMVEVIA